MSFSKRIIVWVLLFSVLFGTLNFKVYEHTCLLTGVKKSSFSQISSFCNDSSDSDRKSDVPAFSRSSCCKIEIKECRGKQMAVNVFKVNFEKSTLLYSDFFISLFKKVVFLHSADFFNTPLSSFSSKIFLRNLQILI